MSWENYKDWHFRRFEKLPGLTGLAQISGRSALAFDGIIRTDIEYIDNRSMQQGYQNHAQDYSCGSSRQ